MTSESEYHEYAYDVKLYAVVRVRANSRASAEKILAKALDAASLDVAVGIDAEIAFITEASVQIDDVGFPLLFEIDGQEVHCEDVDGRVNLGHDS